MAVVSPIGGNPIFIEKANADPSILNQPRFANAIGLVTQSGLIGEVVPVQYDDVLELTTAQWDAVTDGVGGLMTGLTYYVSDVTSGHITTTSPGINSYRTIVGSALNTTQMLIMLGYRESPPP